MGAYHHAMVRTKKPGRGSGFRRPFDWLDRKLLPVIGPPPLGPWEASDRQEVHVCPVCGHELREHTLSSTDNPVLNCPVAHSAGYERDAGSPLNELGMPKRSAVG